MAVTIPGSTWYTDNILLKTSDETNNTSRTTMLATLATVPNFIESTLSITEPKWLKYNFVTISRCSFRFSSRGKKYLLFECL
jgi:hypothetical protein